MEVKKHDKSAMFLRTELATGDIEGDTFELALNVDGACLIATFPEAKYTVSMKSIMADIIKFREKQEAH